MPFRAVPGHRYDFVIVCNQRSGSHLLASLLDSHPDIECDGEIGSLNDPLFKVEPDGEKLRGGIVMYQRLGRIKDIRPKSIIHLVRDPLATATSEVTNSISRKLNRKSHRAHRFKDEDPIETAHISPKPETVKRKVAHIIKMRNRLVRAIQKKKLHALEIHYEDLTQGGTSISKCPQGITIQLCKFLGLREHPLTTGFRKSRDEDQHRDRAEEQSMDTAPDGRGAATDFWRKY